jgi:hypothetical protein
MRPAPGDTVGSVTVVGLYEDAKHSNRRLFYVQHQCCGRAAVMSQRWMRQRASRGLVFCPACGFETVERLPALGDVLGHARIERVQGQMQYANALLCDVVYLCCGASDERTLEQLRYRERRGVTKCRMCWGSPALVRKT